MDVTDVGKKEDMGGSEERRVRRARRRLGFSVM